jgi:hypothetical protein
MAPLPPKVLDLYPEATVVGSKVCINFLQGLTLRWGLEGGWGGMVGPEGLSAGGPEGEGGAGLLARRGSGLLAAAQQPCGATASRIAPNPTANPRREFKSRAVKGGDRLDLGGGHDLEFVMAPNLHWWGGARGEGGRARGAMPLWLLA